MNYYQRRPDAVTRRIGEEMVLVPIRRQIADLDSIYTLNCVAAEIWECLASPQSPAMLADTITAGYEVCAEQAADDVAAFLAEMTALGLVESVNG